MQWCANKALKLSPSTKRIMNKCQAISEAMDTLYKEQDILCSRRLGLLTVNATSWNSHYTMAGRIFEVMGAIEATYHQMETGTADERTKFAEEAPAMLDSEEIATLGEILEVLKPMTEFTHWVDQVNNPTISQIYHRIYTMSSVLDSLVTEPALELFQNLDRLIKDSWPLDEIPDVALVAIYLNPACASLAIFDQTIVEDHRTLRDKKGLAVEALVSFLKMIRQNQMDGSTRDDALHEKLDSSLYNISALHAVGVHDIQVKMCPKDFEHYMDTPETYWKSLINSDTHGALATISRSYLCIQATSSESEFSSKGGLAV